MRTIYKYPLLIKDEQELFLPIGANIIHVNVDPREQLITAWVIVETERPLEGRTIKCYGTGHILPESSETHLGTVMYAKGVWHYFEPPYYEPAENLGE